MRGLKPCGQCNPVVFPGTVCYSTEKVNCLVISADFYLDNRMITTCDEEIGVKSRGEVMRSEQINPYVRNICSSDAIIIVDVTDFKTSISIHLL